MLLSKNIRATQSVRRPQPEPTRSCTREPLPRCGATDVMRAGRAGAGGGSDARAHRRPSLSACALGPRSEQDRDTSLSQRQLVNTNRPRSRDKIFDLHFTTHTSAMRARRDEARTLAQCSQIASGRRHRRGCRRCATFDNFSRKLTCTATVGEARPLATCSHQNSSQRTAL